MSYEIKSERTFKLTPKRLEWLRLLSASPRKREKGKTGYQLGSAGFAEDNLVTRRTGKPISYREASKRWGARDRWNHVIIKGERITTAGRELLEHGQLGKRYPWADCPDAIDENDPDRYATVAKPMGDDEGKCWGLVWEITLNGLLINRQCKFLAPLGKHCCKHHEHSEEKAVSIDMKGGIQ